MEGSACLPSADAQGEKGGTLRAQVGPDALLEGTFFSLCVAGCQDVHGSWVGLPDVAKLRAALGRHGCCGQKLSHQDPSLQDHPLKSISGNFLKEDRDSLGFSVHFCHFRRPLRE